MQPDDFAVVVPARLASTRLPQKLLADLHGRPVLARTLAALKEAVPDARHLYVATADAPLAQVARSCGVAVLPTPAEASSGTHRVALASPALPASVRWVVNVQGDEPLLEPDVLRQVLAQRSPRVDLLTAVCPITPDEWRQPSTVKALVDRSGRALWFGRGPLPHRLATASDTVLTDFLASEPGVRRHLGIYAFRRDRLLEWPHLPRTAMATQAGLEQLDALLAGWVVHATEVDRPRGPSVDTAADLETVRAIWTAHTAGKPTPRRA